jgi:hypothetical protein
MLGFSKKEDGIEESDDKIYVNISNMLFSSRYLFSTNE